MLEVIDRAHHPARFHWRTELRCEAVKSRVHGSNDTQIRAPSLTKIATAKTIDTRVNDFKSDLPSGHRGMGLATRPVPGENMKLHRKQNPMGLLDAYFFAVMYWQGRPSRLEGAASGTCYESGNLKGYAAILPIQKRSYSRAGRP